MSSRPHNQPEAKLAMEAEMAVEMQEIGHEEAPFGLIIGSAWALLFTGMGALLVLSLLAISR